MGLQRRERGPTRGLFVVWAKSIREQRPIIVVFENVSKYPVALLVSLFGDIYDISDAVIDACELGAPSRRLRLYCVMCLKRHMRLQRPLCDLVDVLGLVKGDRLSAQDLLFSHGPAMHLSPSASSYKKCYVKTFGFPDGFYDLSQNPSFRPRACTGSEPLFTLTTSTGIVWSVAEARCMSATELAAAQGLPSHPSLACALGTQRLDFSCLKRGTWSRMVGNGMSVACVGAVLAWVNTYAVTTCGDVPRAPTVPSQDKAQADDGLHDVGGPAHVSDKGRAWRLLGDIGSLVLDRCGPFGACFSDNSRGDTGRQRGIFPLPLPLFDDLFETFIIISVAARCLHINGNTGFIFSDQVQDNLIQFGSMITTIATRDVNGFRVFLMAVLTIEMEAR